MNNKNKWSIIINALLTAITGILTAYGILLNTKRTCRLTSPLFYFSIRFCELYFEHRDDLFS